jgi:tetratricopeptide (TPR) repeat protein
LANCDKCPGQSEPRFHLGRYYQKKGKNAHALNEFGKVKEDSPNYYQAKHYILESYVQELEKMEKRGLFPSEKSMDIYKNGVRLLDECRKVEKDKKAAANKNKMGPHTIIIQAKLHLYGPDNALAKNLKILEGFPKHYSRNKTLCLKAAKLRIEYYFQLKRVKEAETEIKRLIVDPSLYADLNDIANTFYTKFKRAKAKGEKSASRQYAEAAFMIYEKLYTISRDNTSWESYSDPVQLRMAQICVDGEKFDRATQLYKDILLRNPQSAEAVYGLGLIYERDEKWHDALQIWRRFSNGVTAGTHHWFQSRYRTAVALNKLGKTDKACAVTTMTMVLHPDFNDDALKNKFLDFQSKLCKKELVR